MLSAFVHINLASCWMQALVLCCPTRLYSVDVATRRKGSLWESLVQGMDNTVVEKAGQGWP